MSDLIDRQALLKQIDIDSDGEPGYYGDTWKFIDTIKNMPNVHDLPKDTDTISRAKAIEALTEYGNGRAVYIAVEEAVRRIEQLPPANCSEFPNNSDTISRQAAIKALDKRFDSIPMEQTTAILLLRRDLRELPPAQPEQCEDAVNRETILKFFDGWMSVLDENCHNQSVSDLKIIKRDFANLPSVTPKQQTGKWIKLDMHRGMADHKCTACEQECYVPTCMGEPMYVFCPNCGAKMEVTE